jgi:hypothetical protein
MDIYTSSVVVYTIKFIDVFTPTTLFKLFLIQNYSSFKTIPHSKLFLIQSSNSITHVDGATNGVCSQDDIDALSLFCPLYALSDDLSS